MDADPERGFGDVLVAPRRTADAQNRVAPCHHYAQRMFYVLIPARDSQGLGAARGQGAVAFQPHVTPSNPLGYCGSGIGICPAREVSIETPVSHCSSYRDASHQDFVYSHPHQRIGELDKRGIVVGENKWKVAHSAQGDRRRADVLQSWAQRHRPHRAWYPVHLGFSSKRRALNVRAG